MLQNTKVESKSLNEILILEKDAQASLVGVFSLPAALAACRRPLLNGVVHHHLALPNNDNRTRQAHHRQDTADRQVPRCASRPRSTKRRRRDSTSFHASWRGSLARASAAAALCGCLLASRCAGEVRSVSRVYHSACLERGQSYWDYENFRLSSLRWEDVDRYEVNGRLGFGRFSEVMEGLEVDSGRKVVLKVLKPARSYKIKREIRVLQVSSEFFVNPRPS